MKLVPWVLCLCLLLISADSAPVMKTQITGDDEVYTADVILEDGVKKLSTKADVTVEEIFGQDPQGTSYFFFGDTLEDADGIGASDDTVRVQIPAGVSPLNAIYPAVDVTTTVTAAHVASDNPERSVAIQVCIDLNADSNFIDAKWKCIVARDFALVHIESRLFNEFGERTTWTVTCSGTTVCNLGFGNIARRGKPTELSRSPNDPRQGILAIAGTVSTVPGGIGDVFEDYFVNSSTSSDQRIDCKPYVSGTCDFYIYPTDKRRFVEAIRCFGGANGIKFGRYLAVNIVLTGIEISARSEGFIFTFPLIRRTEDWKNIFASSPGDDFRIDIQAGVDQFIAQFRPDVPIALEPTGTVAGGDDYLRIKLQDDLSSGIVQQECIAVGFEREP